VAGGLAVYGVLWLGRRLLESTSVKRAARLLSLVVEELTTSDAPPRRDSETVFQAEAASTAAPLWTAHNARAASHYGPN
jgi:hypothetical protein